MIFCLAVHLMNFQNLQRLCRKDGNYYRGKSAGTCRSSDCQEDGSSMETVIPQIKEAAVIEKL